MLPIPESVLRRLYGVPSNHEITPKPADEETASAPKDSVEECLVVSLPGEDAVGSDFIKFGGSDNIPSEAILEDTDDEEESESESDEEDEGIEEENRGTRKRLRQESREDRSRRIVNRHFSSVTDNDLEGMKDEEGSDDDFDSISLGSFSSSSSSSSTSSTSHAAVNPTGGGFGDQRQRKPLSPTTTTSPTAGSASPTEWLSRGPQKFRSIYFETRLSPPTLTREGEAPKRCYYTLIAFQSPPNAAVDASRSGKKAKGRGERSREGTVPPRDPHVTIQGPCAVFGSVWGRKRTEMSLSGYRLQHNGAHRAPVVLWSEGERAVLQSVKRWGAGGAAGSAGEKGSSWRAAVRSLSERSPVIHQLVSGPGRGKLVFAEEQEAEEDSHVGGNTLCDVESVFGAVDWEWVGQAVASWSAYFGGAEYLPTISLILHLYNPSQRHSGVQRFYLKRNLNRDGIRPAKLSAEHHEAGEAQKKGHEYIDIPSIIARHREPQIDTAAMASLLPDLLCLAVPPRIDHSAASAEKKVLSGGGRKTNYSKKSEEEDHSDATKKKGKPGKGSSEFPGSRLVCMVGSSGTGKSTLCRYLVNAWLSVSKSSRRGVGWLELDLGQPEFGVPGEIGLYRITQPVFAPRVCAGAAPPSHSLHGVEAVQTFFLGHATPSCPLTVAKALSSLCALVEQLQSCESTCLPIVVNTHGWVLDTGRRSTMECLRRLTPSHIVHLLRDGEPCWTAPMGHAVAAAGAALSSPASSVPPQGLVYRYSTAEGSELPLSKAPWMSTVCGLNGDVVRKRFLTRFRVPSAAGAEGSLVQLLSRLPPPATKERSSASSSGPRTAAAAAGARCAVHVMPVTWRSEEGGNRGNLLYTAPNAAVKGVEGRRQRWLTYLMPLVDHYSEQSSAAAEGGEPETTLLRAPISQLRLLAVVDQDEKNAANVSESGNPRSSLEAMRRRLVGALLEHTVVAVQIGCTVKASPSSASSSSPTVVSLASLPESFPVTCYGYVESTEEELLGSAQQEGGLLRLRVPLAPSVVRRLLRSDGDSDHPPGVAIACSQALHAETSFLDHLFLPDEVLADG